MSDVATIVADVRAARRRGVREWSLRLDGAEPRAREPDARACRPTRCSRSPTPSAAGTSCSGRADVRLEIAPGVELERRWVPLALGRHLRAARARLDARHVRRAGAGRRRRADRRRHAARRRAGSSPRRRGCSGSTRSGRVGGPQAIAALAYGTESIPRVDKIVGPGNAYVNEAKLLVSRDVAIDLPAGPSEVVVLAGADADRRVVELELAAQAEHGPDSVCRVVEVDGDLDAALAEVEALAPEHLVLLGEAEALAPRVPQRRRGLRRRLARPSPRATTRPAATTSCRPAAGRARSAGSGSRRS